MSLEHTGFSMNRNYSKLRALLLLLLFAIVGCSSMSVTPELAPLNKAPVLIKGPIQYDGNRLYLPRTIAEGDLSEYGLRFRYITSETQDRSSWDVIALLNPLSVLGFPTGRRNSTVTGTLEMLKGAEVVKSYTATCLQEAHRGIYYGESFSDLRRTGLVAVRDNIEAQMFQDRELLEKATSKVLQQ
jgi:hypothetical protein